MYLTLNDASNLGTFISGIATLIGVSVAFFEFRAWLKRKRLEKKSEWAEQSLDLFDSYLFQIDEWFTFINFPIGKDELMDYSKKFIEIQKILIKAKNRSYLLEDKKLNQQFIELENLTKLAQGHFRRSKEFVNSNKEVEQNSYNAAMQYIYNTPEEVKKIGGTISDCLRKFMKLY